MEKDIAKIPKNPDTDIVVRIDDFGGRIGLTIREFVKSERYTGFTKAGTRIPAEYIKQFKHAINSIDESEINALSAAASAGAGENKSFKKPAKKQTKLSSGVEEQSSSGHRNKDVSSGDEESEEVIEDIEEEAM